MRKRLVISLIVLALAGGAAAYVLTRKDPHASKGKVVLSDAKAPLAKLEPAKLDELEIIAPPEGAPAGAPVHVKLKRKDPTSWQVVEPFSDTASPDAMQLALEGLGGLTWRRPVADSVEAMASLGCDDLKGVHIVARGGGAVLGDLYICGELDRARLAASSQVWETAGLERWRLAKASAKEWRHLLVAEVPTEEIATLTLHNPGGALTVARRPPPDGGSGDRWHVVAADPALAAVDQGLLEGLAARLARLTATDVAEGVTDADTGLAAETAWLEVKTTGGGGIKLVLGKDAAEQTVYLRKVGSDRIYRVAKDVASELARAPRELMSRRVGAAGLTAFTIDAAGERWSVRKSGAAWQAAGQQADASKLADLASKLESLTAVGIASPAPDAKTFGKPAATITLTGADGLHTLRIGAVKDSSRYLARDDGTVFLIDTQAADPLTKAPSTYLH